MKVSSKSQCTLSMKFNRSIFLLVSTLQHNNDKHPEKDWNNGVSYVDSSTSYNVTFSGFWQLEGRVMTTTKIQNMHTVSYDTLLTLQGLYLVLVHVWQQSVLQCELVQVQQLVYNTNTHQVLSDTFHISPHNTYQQIDFLKFVF